MPALHRPREVEIGAERLTRRADLHQCRRPRDWCRRWPGVDQVPYLTNSSRCWTVDFLPRHLVIVGGGYVGLEFAQIYRRFGSEVTVIEMAPRLIQHEDEDVSAAVRRSSSARGSRSG